MSASRCPGAAYLTHGATMPRRACAVIPGSPPSRRGRWARACAEAHAAFDCIDLPDIALVVLSSPLFPGGDMEDRSAKYRAFYAQLICAAARAADPRIEEAFRTVRREPF